MNFFLSSFFCGKEQQPPERRRRRQQRTETGLLYASVENNFQTRRNAQLLLGVEGRRQNESHDGSHSPNQSFIVWQRRIFSSPTLTMDEDENRSAGG